MSEPSAIPDEWHKAADEAAKVLSVARAVECRQYPEGNTPDGLLASLVVAAALARVRDACLAVADQVQCTGEPMLIERLAGIENELYRLANFADEQSVASWRLPPKGNSDGGR